MVKAKLRLQALSSKGEIKGSLTLSHIQQIADLKYFEQYSDV